MNWCGILLRDYRGPMTYQYLAHFLASAQASSGRREGKGKKDNGQARRVPRLGTVQVVFCLFFCCRDMHWPALPGSSDQHHATCMRRSVFSVVAHISFFVTE